MAHPPIPSPLNMLTRNTTYTSSIFEQTSHKRHLSPHPLHSQPYPPTYPRKPNPPPLPFRPKATQPPNGNQPPLPTTHPNDGFGPVPLPFGVEPSSNPYKVELHEVLSISACLSRTWMCAFSNYYPTPTLTTAQQFLQKSHLYCDKVMGPERAEKWADNGTFQLPAECYTKDINRLVASNLTFDDHVDSLHTHMRKSMMSPERLQLCDTLLQGALPTKLYHQLYDLSRGLKIFVEANFVNTSTPNPPRKTYLATQHAVHKLLYNQWSGGTVLLLPIAELQSGKWGPFHFSDQTWGANFDKDSGRLAGDWSHALRGMNINGSTTDAIAEVIQWAETTFGQVNLPTLPQLIDLIYQAAEKYGWDNITLIKADVKAAFNQILFNAADVRRTAFPLINGLAVLHLVANFGWRCTPFAWNVISKVVILLVRHMGLLFAAMYVDDLMAACRKQDAENFHDTVENIFVHLMGEGARAPAKRGTGRRLTWLGWFICLDTRTVQPSHAILLKTAHSLFSTALDADWHLSALQALASRCQRLTIVAPILTPFTHAIYNDISHFNDNKSITRKLSHQTRHDITFFRSYILMLGVHPEQFAYPLSQFRHQPWTVALGHDGSLTGLGVWIGLRDHTTNTVHIIAFVRLHPLPFQFTDDSSYQNSHEFLCIVVGLFLARSMGLKGFQFSVLGDSMTTLSWVAKNKPKSKLARRAAVAYALLTAATTAQPGFMFYVTSKDNNICDAWSRGMTNEFSQQIPSHLEIPLTTNHPIYQLIELCNPQLPLPHIKAHSTLYSSIIGLLQLQPPSSIPMPTNPILMPPIHITSTPFTPGQWY
jgi:hypothetical protein